MVLIRRVTAAAASAALILGLGGCALIEPADNEVPLTEIEQCILGSTWNLDLANLAEQVRVDLAARGVAVSTVTGEGTQTLEWDLERRVTIETDYVLTMNALPAADQAIVVTSTHIGRSTGVAYLSGAVAIPRKWDATGLVVTSTAQLNAAPLEPVPFTEFTTDIDDAVGIELTCLADTLTTHPRGRDLTHTWTRG